MLVLLLTPVMLYAQERAYDPAPLMAMAVEAAITPHPDVAGFVEAMRARGEPIPERVTRKERYKLSTTIYSFENPERRDTPFPGTSEMGRSQENPALASDVATRLGLATTAGPAAEERKCTQIPYPPERNRAGGYTVCRFTQVDAVVAASLPVVSGDTALVRLSIFANALRETSQVAISVVDVKLVRTNNGWKVVSTLNVMSIG
jgi:hypothetical protein